MKPLMEYAPFKIGERFEDEEGYVLEITSHDGIRYVNGTGYPFDIRLFGGKLVKPLDRTSEALDELAQLDADETCGPKPWRDMNDDEKAPILLAWAEGKAIEWWDDEMGTWWAVRTGPKDWCELAYRIAPEVVRKGPREFWVYHTERGSLVVGITPRDDAIHVREVTE